MKRKNCISKMQLIMILAIIQLICESQASIISASGECNGADAGKKKDNGIDTGTCIAQNQSCKLNHAFNGFYAGNGNNCWSCEIGKIRVSATS